MHKYRTNFRLTDKVNNITAAQEYLNEEDMSIYLLDDFPNLASYNIKIGWFLTDPNKGYVELTSDEKLDEVTLIKISKWVSDQNSDGIGAGFSQQDFASYEIDEPRKGYEEEYIECSFDWEKNEYKFEEIEQ